MILLFLSSLLSSFFFNDTATTEIYTLSLHDALPISARVPSTAFVRYSYPCRISMSVRKAAQRATNTDRKSTRLNSSHVEISYAVFCLKKKKKRNNNNKNKKNLKITTLSQALTNN